MKKIMMSLIALMLFSFAAAKAESAKSQLENLIGEKDYLEAAKYITSAINEKPKDEEVYLMCGDVYYELNNLDSALIMYKKAYEIEDEEKDIIIKLSKVYSELGKNKESIELVRKAEKEFKKDVYIQLALANALIKADSINTADLIIRKAQDANPKMPQVWIALADLYFAKKVYTLAVDNYLKALELDSKLVDARINLATSYYWLARLESDKDLKNGYYSNCLQEWEKIANDDPKNAKAFWEAGKIYYFSQLWEEAAKYLNKYVQLRPNQPLARYYLVESLYQIKQCEPLQEHIDIVANEIDSVKTKVKFWQADCFYKQQNYQAAIDAYNKLRQNNTLNADQLEAIAVSYLYSLDTLNAIKAYKEVIAVDPKRTNTLTAFGTLAFTIKDYESAITFLSTRDANIKDSLAPKLRYYLGLAYLMSEKFDLAVTTMENVLVDDAVNYSAMVYLSDAYVKMGNKDTAKFILNNAIKIMSADVAANEANLNNAQQKLASIYLEEKNFKAMNTMCKEWADKLPTSQQAFLFYAISFQGLKDKDGACRNYKKVLTIDSKSELGKIAKKYLTDLQCD